MPQLDHKGPEGTNPKAGRKLGRCKKTTKEETDSQKYELGTGMGKRRKVDEKPSTGKGKRNDTYKI